MAWVKFVIDYDYQPENANWCIAYKAGMRFNVTAPCRDHVVPKYAVDIETPSRALATRLKTNPSWRGE